MSQSVPLQVSGSVTLDGSGNGTVQLGPQIAGVSWQPTAAGVLVAPASTSVVSLFKLYLGQAQPQNFIGGSYSGDSNSAGLAVTLYPGQVITGVWTGGNPGATATLTLSGTQTIPGTGGTP
jgi:hypothetical protein